jgi:hypothetical protein
MRAGAIIRLSGRHLLVDRPSRRPLVQLGPAAIECRPSVVEPFGTLARQPALPVGQERPNLAQEDGDRRSAILEPID